ncbi:MAG: AAA family ATPase [Deltaproteobacteria bacterium]|nr:AAA family ATPase [Deltaproteobacteria bacterium]
MNIQNETIPNPKEIEKEIGEFLAKKFGGSVKMVSQDVHPQENTLDDSGKTPKAEDTFPPKAEDAFHCNMKPEDLITYLDQYIVKQDHAKAVLATKICTHFNRIKHANFASDSSHDMVGSIKNNVLMIGPTGVGKTYLIKLIAKKIGVPFVKGDATKFSETGYVGGDVEDLVRDLVREANDNIELAQYGIIYIDEIDKIAGSRNMIGVDVSRTGVQRALLKPMEETDVDLKVPHDPISMLQEIERFRKTGNREKRSINTKNILFIMSGAFGDLTEIIHRRMTSQNIGFGAAVKTHQDRQDILNHVKSEDLIEFGFESEFVGRLPVRAIFERLTEDDLFEILKNPNNPVILGKKLDFAAYHIDIKFDDPVLRILAQNAFLENTGARGLVSAVEKALLLFERCLPSSDVKKFPVTLSVLKTPEQALSKLMDKEVQHDVLEEFDRLAKNERASIKAYLHTNRKNLSEKYNLTLTPSRMDIVTSFYSKNVMDVGHIIQKVKSLYDEIKKIELSFYKKHDINIVLEDNAIDFIIEQLANPAIHIADFERQLSIDFELGLKLVREKTGKNRFFITRKALLEPETFISNLIKDELRGVSLNLPDHRTR